MLSSSLVVLAALQAQPARVAVWVGSYQAGLRMVDVSGELRGDLSRQSREVAALPTTDAQSVVPHWSMTWGAQIHKGNISLSDLFSRPWIARLDEQRPVP